ncbi:YbgC/YbaW family acyl-CoA thioester hydrolase [Pullulanibacillus pueri]|uniref:Thioesterase n=1 Tax=Pullulanibacillus pueri TaxID=1437324 RepID=A0A8J2ZS96_9BACL|nr:acyl-CoA thioesterase [Pullulanibacillus pueri]MBM7679953.1 YbgC/YbaW family acyl-CoA thioester hydrolase [Pullulanibacillus pueri]GGH73651.1 thioesterase [Pullulanibacillus pueri]
MREVHLPIVVRSTEIDVNGHVNNAKYLEYLEWSREEWYEQAGLTYDAFLQMGIQTVTVNININYRKECTQGDCLDVKTTPEKVGRTSFVFYQEMTNQKGEVCAEAWVTSVTMDEKTRKAREVPATLRGLFPAE